MGVFMFRPCLIAVLVSASCLAFADDSKPTPAGGAVVVVQIDGVSVTAAEFEQRQSSLFQARNSFYDTQRKALDQFVDEYLLERQAKTENVTVPELLKRHVENVIETDPSDEVLKVYFEGVDSNEPFETAKAKIRDYIRQRRIAKARTSYMERLRSQAKVNVRLEPPRVLLSLSGTPIRGAKDARVTVVEFADYECPYCQFIHPHLSRLNTDFGDKVAFAFKDLPLPSHPNAQKAAEAAHCAGVQGKYWEYHDQLFEKKEFAITGLKEIARSLQLNGEAFDKCLDSGAEAGRVKVSFDQAQALLLPGTPAFFVNGRYLSGAVTYDVLRKAVQEELGKSPASSVEIATK